MSIEQGTVNSEPMHQLGAFEPHEARKLLPRLEVEGIRFEIEADHSALTTPGRWMQLSLGMYPEGSKINVFVPESQLQRALTVVADLFPV